MTGLEPDPVPREGGSQKPDQTELEAGSQKPNWTGSWNPEARTVYCTIYCTVYLRWPVGSWGARPPPKAGANACGGLWRRKICDRRVAAGFGNAIREIYYTHGRCKRLRWPVRFAEEKDAGMGGKTIN